MSWLSLFLFFSSAQNLELIYQNNKAVGAFQAEKKMDAYEQFLETLLINPYDPVVQFNVGSALNALGEEEKSEKLYKQLLVDVDQRLQKGLPSSEQQQWLKVKFAILYNLGVLYQGQKNIDSALEFYQKALELLPDSKEVKTNIEMLISSGGGGKGQGQDKDQKNQDQQGEGDSQQDQDGEGKQDQKQQQGKSPKDQQQKGKKEFDQSQMSMEDLKRIMEELKQQEQGIRSKVQRKGTKSEPKDKQW